MIVFDLVCGHHGHRFEGWFASSEDFEGQQARALVFPAGELKALAKGRGLMLMQLDDGDTLETLAVVEGSAARICGTLRTGREDSFRLEFADYAGKRAKKGKLLPKRWVITAVEPV